MISYTQKAVTRLTPVLTTALVVLALASPLRAADEVTDAEAGGTFKEAFGSRMKLQERVKKLESVLLEYDQNKWTDDAVWALAEFALRNGYFEQSARLHERLLRARKLPCLETFTRNTHLYKTSRVKFEQWLLEQTGHRYAKGRKPLSALPYNPLPMSLSGQLGYIYERLRMRRRALHCYGTAHSMCPPGTLLDRIYSQRIKALKEKLRKEKAEGKNGKEPPRKPTPEWQRMLQEWEEKQAEKEEKKSREKDDTSPSEQRKLEALKRLLDKQKQDKAESDEQS